MAFSGASCLLTLERGEGREKKREKHPSVASHTCPKWDRNRNPGLCPDQESNWRPFNLRMALADGAALATVRASVSTTVSDQLKDSPSTLCFVVSIRPSPGRRTCYEHPSSLERVRGCPVYRALATPPRPGTLPTLPRDIPQRDRPEAAEVSRWSWTCPYPEVFFKFLLID